MRPHTAYCNAYSLLLPGTRQLYVQLHRTQTPHEYWKQEIKMYWISHLVAHRIGRSDWLTSACSWSPPWVAWPFLPLQYPHGQACQYSKIMFASTLW